MTSGDAGYVQGVLGKIAPQDLGHTQTHEHLLCDLSELVDDNVPASRRELVDEEIRLENYHRIRRYSGNRPNMRLTSIPDAIEEMTRYRAAGGGAIIDCTPIDLARDPDGLAAISQVTGVAIVMGTGYYVAAVHTPELREADIGDIEAGFYADITEGSGDGQILPGIIGEIGLTWPVDPVEEKVLRAAARVQIQTGLPLNIHPGRDTQAPLAAMRIVFEEGVNPDRVVVSHIDRTLFQIKDMIELAKTGAYLEFDLFGQEASYYPRSPIDMPNDATRIDCILDLGDAGYAGQIVASQDICHKVNITKYGGEGYTHILHNVLPLMKRKGMSEEDIDVLFTRNPRRLLTVEV